ncbi:hypothetical protein [Streptomyces sp. NPDC056190]|uniref:hypothetical protein n=1 Tax=Streptomyces sp. NPDC056190 TaxID=3345741 RepID=UPI0035D912FF
METHRAAARYIHPEESLEVLVGRDAIGRRVAHICVAAMSISVPILRWDDDQKARCVDLVLAGAREMSQLLGAPAAS